MELISGFFFIVIIGIISYVFTRKENIGEIKEEVETNKEIERRKKILEQVEIFLSGALYYGHIGNWNKEKVYKYISNQGRVYEFADFMSDNNQKIGIDDDNLCFKRMAYKRNDIAVANIVIA